MICLHFDKPAFPVSGEVVCTIKPVLWMGETETKSIKDFFMEAISCIEKNIKPEIIHNKFTQFSQFNSNYLWW